MLESVADELSVGSQHVSEAESVSAGAGAAAELDQGGGGGRQWAAAVLVHAG